MSFQDDFDLFFTRMGAMPTADELVGSFTHTLERMLPPDLSTHFVKCLPFATHNHQVVMHHSFEALNAASAKPVDAYEYCIQYAGALAQSRAPALEPAMRAMGEAGAQGMLSRLIEGVHDMEQEYTGLDMRVLQELGREDATLHVRLQAALCCAQALLAGVPSPEMWPTPPAIWRRHKLALRAYNGWTGWRAQA